MIRTRSLLPLVLVFAFVAAPAAQAQEERGLFPGLFGRRDQPPPQQNAQDPAELMIRIERLENQLRQLTGTVEQLQYQNQQLQQRLGANPAADTPPQRGPQRPPQTQPQNQPQAAPPQLPPPQNRRGDAFDPDANPEAPGRPRNLGVVQNQPPFPPGAAKTAVSEATARSALATSWQPAAVATPCTWAITGLGRRTMRCISREHSANTAS